MTNPLGADLFVEINFAADASWTNAFVLDSATKGVLGTSTLADDAWVNVSADVKLASVRHGRSDPTRSYESGLCTIELDNVSGNYDPTNLAGPYVAGGITQIVPNRRIRIRAVENGFTYFLFYGLVDDWALRYGHFSDATATVTASDYLKVLAGNNLTPVASSFAGDTYDVRASRVLDAVGIDSSMRVLDRGTTTFAATTFAKEVTFESTGNTASFGYPAIEYLRKVADTEGGVLYADTQGRINVKSRLSVVEEARSATSQATFGPFITGATSSTWSDPAAAWSDPTAGWAVGEIHVPYESVSVVYTFDDIRNIERFTRQGGVMQTATDAASQAKYGNATHEETGLLMDSDPQALGLARWWLKQEKDDRVRVNQIQTNPMLDVDARSQALQRQLRDRVSVVIDRPGVGVSTQQSIIEGVAHTITPNSWRTAYSFTDAARFSFAMNGFKLDTSLLNTGTVGY